MSVAGIERMHRLAKSVVVSKLMTWINFVCSLDCKHQRFYAMQTAWEMRARLRVAGVTDDPPVQGIMAPRKRSKAAWEIYKDDCIKKVKGVSTSRTTSGHE